CSKRIFGWRWPPPPDSASRSRPPRSCTSCSAPSSLAAVAASGHRRWRRRPRSSRAPDLDRARAGRVPHGMLVDTAPATADPRQAAQAARDAEQLGYDGVWTAEAGHDPYLPCALAATATERVTIGTNITVAFPRSPLVHAQIAWDLQAASRGRFILGLGTQVKGHNERR